VASPQRFELYQAINDNPATTHAKAEFVRESEAADRQQRLDRS